MNNKNQTLDKILKESESMEEHKDVDLCKNGESTDTLYIHFLYSLPKFSPPGFISQYHT